MTSAAPVLTRPDCVADLQADLVSSGIERTDIEVDNAIEVGVENWILEVGSSTVPEVTAGTQRWDEMIGAILTHLGLDYDEVYEVAP